MICSGVYPFLTIYSPLLWYYIWYRFWGAGQYNQGVGKPVFRPPDFAKCCLTKTQN